ncbi:PAS domain-containing protein [Hymenobacter sp. HSC-4F20]|uniref:PAS domain-containing sensor histidine kinase n=1 Tax=Hymenobacter sp. HSC-4F20 TaxID=2864135 RepID=UPI001C735F99|nr:PAS domain-containing sensor histidine kinase [Hymenobacter sp. HSC-4F20]MBX0290246.1 PAS domain-containing protein [Hymenobacter sp. HSC-4F20]
MPDYPKYFRSFLDRSKAVHFAYHVAQRRLVYVSPAYEQVLGGRLADANEELPGWLGRIHPPDLLHLRQCMRRALRGELVQDVRLRVEQADGQVQWLCLTACLQQLADEEYYLSGSVMDVTRSTENRIHAEKFNTKKNATLEILSHDLAAPLVLLQQLTEHLRVEAGEVSASVQQVLGLMERTCREGVSLIRDFVDNEFMESVNVELQRERTDLGGWLATIIEEYQLSERHTHLQFELLVPRQAVYVSLDVNKFQQVINNLISNAIKFTPDGGRIRVSLEPGEQQVLVQVADTGVGIPEKLQPLLFDKFTRARRPGLRGEKATGLGMSIIQTIVGLHEGTIQVASREGEGTCFSIMLPAFLV